MCPTLIPLYLNLKYKFHTTEGKYFLVECNFYNFHLNSLPAKALKLDYENYPLFSSRILSQSHNRQYLVCNTHSNT
jgi:hypothetical protein